MVCSHPPQKKPSLRTTERIYDKKYRQAKPQHDFPQMDLKSWRQQGWCQSEKHKPTCVYCLVTNELLIKQQGH